MIACDISNTLLWDTPGVVHAYCTSRYDTFITVSWLKTCSNRKENNTQESVPDIRWFVSQKRRSNSRSILEKLLVPQLIMKFSTSYGTTRLFTIIPKARYSSLFCARLIQSTAYHPISFKFHFIIILPRTHMCAKWYLSLKFPHQHPACNSPLPNTCYMPRPSHSSWLDYLENVCWRTHHKAPRYAVFSTPLLPRPS